MTTPVLTFFAFDRFHFRFDFWATQEAYFSFSFSRSRFTKQRQKHKNLSQWRRRHNDAEINIKHLCFIPPLGSPPLKSNSISADHVSPLLPNQRSLCLNVQTPSSYKPIYIPPHSQLCCPDCELTFPLSLSLSEVSWNLTNLETQIQIRFKLLVPYPSWRLWTTKTQALCLVRVNHLLNFSASFSSFMLLFELFSLHNLKFKSHSLFGAQENWKGRKKT